MAKIQKRRSISMNRHLYARFRAYCEAQDVSMAGMVDELVNAKLDAIDAQLREAARSEP